MILRYSGADSNDPVSVSGADDGTSSSPTALDVTTTVANTTVLRIAGVADNVLELPTDVYPSGHVGRVGIESGPPPPTGGSVGLGAADTIQASANETGKAGFSLTSSTARRVVTVAINPAVRHTLDITVSGSFSVSGNVTYTHGSTADTSSVTPGAGSEFDGWSGADGAECAIGSVSMVTSKECTAIFIAGDYPPVNRVTSAFIGGPALYTAFLATSMINFSGLGDDAEDGSLFGGSLVWISSIDGLVGTGELIEGSLSPGNHVMRLIIIDREDDTGFEVTNMAQ